MCWLNLATLCNENPWHDKTIGVIINLAMHLGITSAPKSSSVVDDF